MVTAEATVTKWGNGRGILLPKEMCDGLGANIGDKLSLVLDEANRAIRVEPVGSYTLSSLMAGYDGPKPGEIDAPGSSAGREMW